MADDGGHMLLPVGKATAAKHSGAQKDPIHHSINSPPRSSLPPTILLRNPDCGRDRGDIREGIA